MEKLKAFWFWLTTSRYQQHLESENKRLREENRGLLNSLLLVNRVPSIERANGALAIGGVPAPMPNKMSSHQRQAQLDREAYQRQQKERAAAEVEYRQAIKTNEALRTGKPQ